MMSYPQHSTQPRDNLFWRRGNFNTFNSNRGGTTFLQADHDLSFSSGTGGWFASLESNIDLTKLTLITLDTKIDSNVAGRIRIEYGGATNITQAVHDWTRRVIDISSRTGMTLVRVTIEATTSGGITAQVRNIRVY
jgi:hypothetical protein